MGIIRQSVGKNGKNNVDDVTVIQLMLNRNMKAVQMAAPIKPNGVAGADTIAAIEAFQKNKIRMRVPDGVIDPNGTTIRRLALIDKSPPSTSGKCTLESSVGEKGFNYEPDVKFIQSLLKGIGIYDGTVNGKSDPKLVQKIKLYQKGYANNPDGLISPNKITIKKLLSDPLVNGPVILKACHQLSVETAFQAQITNPIANGQLRGTDDYGSGAYNASRGSRKHRGIDIVAASGAKVVSPIDGRIERESAPYSDDSSYSGLLIKGVGKHKSYRVKIFYLKPKSGFTGNRIRKKILEGEEIGTVQDLTKKYKKDKNHNNPITNHVHIEVKKNRSRIDPSTVLTLYSPPATATTATKK